MNFGSWRLGGLSLDAKIAVILQNYDEWLEPDGLGGFASGTVSGIRTRRYHALLLTATTPPTGRVVLVNGFDAWIETGKQRYNLTSQKYAPDVIHPDGANRIAEFHANPWPSWNFRLENGLRIEQQIFARSGAPLTAISWQLNGLASNVWLFVRPFLSGRDYHSMHHENASFRFDAQAAYGTVVWHPYSSLPGIVCLTNAEYCHDPVWYHNFQYDEERTRGLDFTEDLASPGTFRFDLSRGEAVLILAAEGPDSTKLIQGASPEGLLDQLRAAEEERREEFSSRYVRSASDFIVRRGKGKTIVAGYPWFTDWGRDTFIAMRGLCIATGQLQTAREILAEWAGAVSEGMLPNRFPDRGEAAEFNSVDASLWYVIAVYDYLKAAAEHKVSTLIADREILQKAIEAILTGYSNGTRFGIRADGDGLLKAGVPGVQLTWMDAKVGDWVVTPRIGKPVEIQALWLNALWIAAQFSPKWESLYARGVASFAKKFWYSSGGYLYDVTDADHEPGKNDSSFRPNQIFAIGGLPIQLIQGAQALRIVESVEAKLWTPLGLRSLAPGESGYTAKYEGGPRQRDGSYHEGIVWPWLTGAFVEAWIRTHANLADAKKQAHDKYLRSLLRHLDTAGLNHISEIADAEPPHTPRGCPFQAWSDAELIRALRLCGEEKI